MLGLKSNINLYHYDGNLRGKSNMSRLAKVIPSDYIEFKEIGSQSEYTGTERSGEWIPEAEKNMNSRALLSCVATPGDVGNVMTIFVKSGSRIWFSAWGRNLH